jgi:hypothetical protein
MQRALLYFIFYLLPFSLTAQVESANKWEKLNDFAVKSGINLSVDERLTISKKYQKAAQDFAFKYQYGKPHKLLKYNALQEKIDSSKSKEWALMFLFSTDKLPDLSPLEPESTTFRRLKQYRDSTTSKSLTEYDNFWRWLQRYPTEKFIVINVPSAELTLYEQNEAVLKMKVIVGTKSNQTPIISTYADAVSIYPYWTPTRNITMNELLPKIKSDLGFLDRNNFEVLDKNRQIINPSTLNWSTFSKSNFPYTLRQGTGCDNSLGLLKINIKNPYSVYLHDTPHTTYSKGLFNREKRFFSHGCIRLEKPLELVDALKPTKKIDTELMNKCLLNQTPQVIQLQAEVPVFITYFTDIINESGEIQSFTDYYNLKK